MHGGAPASYDVCRARQCRNAEALGFVPRRERPNDDATFIGARGAYSVPAFRVGPLKTRALSSLL